MSWEAIENKVLLVPCADTGTQAVSCLPFHAVQQIPREGLEVSLHPVHHLPAVFPERNHRSRELQEVLSRDMDQENIKTKEKPVGILWFLLIIVIWFALQAFLLPKLGIST